MANSRSKIYYRGSIFWLIFWLIVFFPIAIVLMALNATCDINGRCYYIEYDGSLFWLFFWAIVFFPIALVLLIINGLSFNVDDNR